MRWRGGRGRRRSSGKDKKRGLVRSQCYTESGRLVGSRVVKTYYGNHTVWPEQGGEVGEEFEGE